MDVAVLSVCIIRTIVTLRAGNATAIDLSGGIFGRWMVLERAGSLAGQGRARLVAVPLQVRERANRARQGFEPATPSSRTRYATLQRLVTHHLGERDRAA